MEHKFGKIQEKFSKDDFIRKVLITLMDEDAPIDVLKVDFSNFTQKEYLVYSTDVNYSLNWQGEIGYYRTESYTDYEKYYEKIPYTDYEKYYDHSEQKFKIRPVTKYRQEERERPVAKTRTVTDWTFTSGKSRGSVSILTCVHNV